MKNKITMCIFLTVLTFLLTFGTVFAKKENISASPDTPATPLLHELTSKNPCNGFASDNKDNNFSNSSIFKTNYLQIESIIKETLSSRGKIVNLPDGTELVLKNGKIMVVYKENSEVTQKYIDVLNEYSKKFSGESKVYVMLIPTQIEFDDSSFKRFSDSQKNTIDYVYSSLENIKTINVYDTLESHKNEYLYFRLDHHWTQRGGYYAYQSFMKEKGESAIPLGLMKHNKIIGFKGYLYKESGVESYAEYVDDIEYFEFTENYPVIIKGVENGIPFEYKKNMYSVPKDESEANYGIFMDGDHQYAEINTSSENGQVALVIKDSYANAVIPFLAIHYQKIIVVDPRSYTGTVTQLTKEHDIDDIIIINNATVPTLPLFVENMADILE